MKSISAVRFWSNGLLIAALLLSTTAAGQHPAPIVPGSENISLGAFALRHPDVIAELGINRAQFERLYRDLESQVIPQPGPVQPAWMAPKPPTRQQIQSLNWLLLDSLSPSQGKRLVQLVNRASVATARQINDKSFLIMPLPIFAPAVHRQLGVDPDFGHSLSEQYATALAALRPLQEEYRRAVQDEIKEFTHRLRELLDEEILAQITEMFGQPVGGEINELLCRHSGLDYVFRLLAQNERRQFFGLLLEEGEENEKGARAQQLLLTVLSSHPGDAQEILQLTDHQLTKLARPARNNPEPNLPDEEGRLFDKGPTSPRPDYSKFPEMMLQAMIQQMRAERQAQRAFTETLDRHQLRRYMQLTNRVAMGRAPHEWVLLDTSVRDHLRMGFASARKIEDEQGEFVRKVLGHQDALRDQCRKRYRRFEDDALNVLTPEQREIYEDWFGATFVFDQPTMALLHQLSMDH